MAIATAWDSAGPSTELKRQRRTLAALWKPSAEVGLCEESSRGSCIPLHVYVIILFQIDNFVKRTAAVAFLCMCVFVIMIIMKSLWLPST